MNGTRANLPCENNLDGTSGYNPPGPSIVGKKGNCSGDFVTAFIIPEYISISPAFRKQSKVSPEVAAEAQDATPATKFSQLPSLRLG
jgi:hypothetical protein